MVPLFYMVGATHGLRMVLNVEQYEYMRGPQNDAGVKVGASLSLVYTSLPITLETARVKVYVDHVLQILLHDQSEAPLISDLGFAVAPGMHTLVGVSRSEVTLT